jgi:hypothetical protein
MSNMQVLRNRFYPVPCLPVGIPFPWFTDTFPNGTLECNGQSFSTTAYPELAKVYPTGVLPDLRGVVLRGKDRDKNGNNRGLDVDGANREAGSYQADETKSHYHVTDGTQDSSKHAVCYGADAAIDYSSQTSSTNDASYITGSKTGNTGGTETRMKNVACYWLVFVRNVLLNDSAVEGGNAITLGGHPLEYFASAIALTGYAHKQNDFVNMLGTSGYQILPSGLIMQWGSSGTGAASSAGSTGTVTLPIAFPSVICSVNLTTLYNTGAGTTSIRVIGVPTLSSFGWATYSGSTATASDKIYWQAIGY